MKSHMNWTSKKKRQARRRFEAVLIFGLTPIGKRMLAQAGTAHDDGAHIAGAR